MSGSNNLEFQSGFEGGVHSAKQQSALGGDAIHGLSKQMFGHGADVQGTTKGSFGMQIGNAATAHSDVLTTNAKMHHVGADGNARFAAQSSQHHDTATQDAGKVVAEGQSFGSDLNSRINPV